MQNKNLIINGISMGKSLSLLLCIFIVSLVLVSFATALIMSTVGAGTAGVAIATALQNIFLFIFPAIATAMFVSRQPMKLTGWGVAPSGKSFLFAALIYVVGLPAMNLIVELNQSIHLPASLHALEEVMRQLEDAAQKTTDVLIKQQSFGGMLLIVAVVGVLTGLGEETFFRGGLQSIFTAKGMSAHKAIWITAIVFSTFHFQFFGFVPRMLLGAIFGYLFVWTGSIWPSVFLHALNNSMVVIFTYCEDKGYITFDLDSLGTDNTLWLAGVSLVAVIILISLRGKFLRR